MNVNELLRRIGRVQLVDVRHPHEWEAGRIEQARHIPLDELQQRLDELDGTRPVVAVCRTGERSTAAAELLRSRGFDAESLDGGMRAWDILGLPILGEDGRPGSVASSKPPPDGLAPPLAAARDGLIEVAYALQDRFGDREPTDEEARAFMLEWLTSKGRTGEEAAALLDG